MTIQIMTEEQASKLEAQARLKKLTYWIARGKQKDVVDIRAMTRKECKLYLHKSYHETPRKVTATYRELLDLIRYCSGTNSNHWEK